MSLQDGPKISFLKKNHKFILEANSNSSFCLKQFKFFFWRGGHVTTFIQVFYIAWWYL